MTRLSVCGHSIPDVLSCPWRLGCLCSSSDLSSHRLQFCSLQPSMHCALSGPGPGRWCPGPPQPPSCCAPGGHLTGTQHSVCSFPCSQSSREGKVPASEVPRSAFSSDPANSTSFILENLCEPSSYESWKHASLRQWFSVGSESICCGGRWLLASSRCKPGVLWNPPPCTAHSTHDGNSI